MFELAETTELTREEQLELELFRLKLVASRLREANLDIQKRNRELIRKTYMSHTEEENKHVPIRTI